MSMRPQMHLVFGVDDFPPGDMPDWEVMETQLYVPEEEVKENPFEEGFLKDIFYNRTTGEWKYIYDSLYTGHEFNLGVIGMIVHGTGYDSDLARTLSVFHPEYKQYGKRDLPVWEQSEHPGYIRNLKEGRFPACSDIQFQWSWFYPSVVETHSMWPVWAYCTRWLLQQAGICEIDYRRFKAMLVWQWS